MTNAELMLAAAEAAGEGVDSTLLGALADAVEELDGCTDSERELAKALRTLPHAYDDDSYHGSPTYKCDVCGCRPPILQNGNKDFGGVCEKSGQHWVRALRKLFNTELSELHVILTAERRAEYLKAKWGSNR